MLKSSLLTEDWFKIGPIEVAMNDDDDSLQDTSSMDSTNIKVSFQMS